MSLGNQMERTLKMDANNNNNRATGLCVTRRDGEYIRLKTKSGEIIWIQSVRAKNDKVEIRIIADNTVNIAREEILPPDEQFKG